MVLKNNGCGGNVHVERERSTLLGASRSVYANQPNESDWIYKDLVLSTGKPAQQCTAEIQWCPSCERVSNVRAPVCPVCKGELEPTRCMEIAADDKNTCATHGGTFSLSPQHKAKLMSSTVVTGASFNQILYCPCNMWKAGCQYINTYFDADGCARCMPEKMLYESIIDHFCKQYDLNDDADLIILQRLAMTLIRITRNERYIASRGEIIKRERGNPDGTVETWFEPNAASAIVSKLDGQLLQWLKGLNVTRAARENKLIIGKTDYALMLSNIEVKEIEM